MLTEILQNFRSFALDLRELVTPAEIPSFYPKGHPSEGSLAGRYLLQRQAHGAAKYDFAASPMAVDRTEARAEIEIAHAFDELDSFVRFVSDHPKAIAFVHAERMEVARLSALLDHDRPEMGMVSMPFRRHPAWVRWNTGAGDGSKSHDLTHVEFADLLLDNAEDLLERALAQYFAKFRAARTVDYVADHDTGSEMGVRLTWSAAKSTDAKVPRDIEANIPAFVGAWSPGAEPSHLAKFRLRVIPPREAGEAQPTFRILWVNAHDYELEAAGSVYRAVVGAFAGKIPTYLGTPSARRFVIPAPSVSAA